MDTEEKWITTIDMIKRMLNDDADKHLTIMEVFHHPTFYNDQKKIDFLLKMYRSLQKIPLEDDIIKSVNEYSLSLLDDQKNIEDKENFNIDYKILFDQEDKFYYFLEGYPKCEKAAKCKKKCRCKPPFKPLTGIINVITLLNGLQNKVTHANDNDEDLPVEFRNDFHVSKIRIIPLCFLKFFWQTLRNFWFIFMSCSDMTKKIEHLNFTPMLNKLNQKLICQSAQIFDKTVLRKSFLSTFGNIYENRIRKSINIFGKLY